MNDPVVNDEARHDRECQQQEALMEQARALAQTAYEAGELDDWIGDKADKHDTFKLALHFVQWLDSGEATEALYIHDGLRLFMPTHNLKDFRATIEHVIEKKALMILEDL